MKLQISKRVDSSTWCCLHAQCCVVGLTHTVTHTEKRTDGNNGAKSTTDLILLEQKGPESVGTQGLEGSQPVGKDEVGGSNPPSSSTAIPRAITVLGILLFLL